MTSTTQRSAENGVAVKKYVDNKPMMKQAVELLVCTLGIYTCYLKYGLLQERIYATKYGDEQFVYSAFLVAVQTAANASVAAVVLALKCLWAMLRNPDVEKSGKGDRENSIALRRKIPIVQYFVVALSYLSAMLFSFTALNHMSYPMQALGKSCKMIPVMLMGIVIRGKRYTAREFACVFMVTAGVALFSFKPSSSKSAPTSLWGVALLFASLFMDGITGPMQENIVSQHGPSSHELMFWQNVCSVCWLTMYLIVSGEGSQAIGFMLRHGADGVLQNVGLFALVSAVGQNFIFYSVTKFSALITTTITTTRKMFTILLSIFMFKHAMTTRQWSGILLVFTAITWEAYYKASSKRSQQTRSTKYKPLESKSQ